MGGQATKITKEFNGFGCSGDNYAFCWAVLQEGTKVLL
jgi:hypothetical protein